MSLNIDDNIIENLYKKYGFFDNEGFLIGTNHENFSIMQKRIDELNRKQVLTHLEEKEGAEMIIVHKAYVKELESYILDNGIVLDDDDDDDIDFEPNDSLSTSYDSEDSLDDSEVK